MMLRNRATSNLAANKAVEKEQENTGRYASMKAHAPVTRALPVARPALGNIKNRVNALTTTTSDALLKKPLPSLKALPSRIQPRPPLRSAKPEAPSTASSKPASTKPLMVTTARTTLLPTVETARLISTKELIPYAKEAEEEPMETSESYSSKLLSNIENIDEGDEGNPLMCAEYVNEIYDYMRKLEVAQFIRERPLDGQQDITSRMRAILLDWLVQVHLRFCLLPETLYMAAMLVDRYLQANACSRDKLQLVGVTAMFVSSKYEEIYAPEINDFVYITDHSYKTEEVRAMERQILRTLDFEIGRPLPIHFLRRFSKAADADSKKHTLAKYLMELSLIDYSMVAVLPSLLAASALYLSNLLTDEQEWDATLSFYSKYDEKVLKATVCKLAKVVQKSHSEGAKQMAVRKKYSTSKFLEISTLPALTGDLIKQLAASAPS